MTGNGETQMVAGPTSAALCMGYGGLELAMEQVLGASPVWCAEFDDAPSSVIEHHWPGLPNYRDLTAIDWDHVAPVDIVTAGYPCQPFSHAGRREGTNDARHLWPYIAECLRVLRPRLAVFENVAGHLSLGFDTVLADLARLGFDAEWVVVRASDVGACHQRARLFIVAHDTACDAGWIVHGERQAAVADPGGGQPERRGGSRGLGGEAPGREGEAQQRQRVRHAALDSGSDAADTHDGADDGQRTRPELGRRDQAATHPQDVGCERVWDARRRGTGPTDGDSWGGYGPAIRHHELAIGRPAPAPVGDGGRLNPPFVEWMQMLPEGHVCDVPGLSRAKQLKLLGNGVVPPQAAYAVNHLLGRLADRLVAA